MMFGVGYQPVGPLIIPTMVLLVLFCRSAPSILSVWLCAVPAVIFGQFLAYVGAFQFGSLWEPESAGPMFGIVLLLSLVSGVFLSLDRVIANTIRAHHPWIEVFLTFPMLWCALWTIVAHVSPFGVFGNQGYALYLLGVDPLTVGTTWWFGAYGGGSFIIALIVSSLIYIFKVQIMSRDRVLGYEPIGGAGQSVFSRRPYIRHPMYWVLYLLVFLHSFGWIYQYYAPSYVMYQKPISEYAPQYLDVTCMSRYNRSHLEYYLSARQQIQQNVATNHLVMWAFDSAQTTIGDQPALRNESDVLHEIRKISDRYGVYLAVSYTLSAYKQPSTSKLAFVVPSKSTLPPGSMLGNSYEDEARIAFIYEMAHPLPLIHNDYNSGQKWRLPYFDTPFGRVGASIGYDYDFYDIVQSSDHKVDVMLQPAAEFGPSVPMHTQMNRLTAVQNGFTLLRCAKGGYSGVYDAFYKVQSEKATIAHNFTMYETYMPIFQHQSTAYGAYKDLLGWIATAVTGIWIILLVLLGLKSKGWLPQSLSRQVFKLERWLTYERL
ncbi:hypothetical protein MIR68_006608 [Amoeboaphelidium protococcarum]|nr:hypothetical protein MIR68_006608 [Amoeboaphelidium protococcarum]